jgi:hypothetical protein
MARKRRRRQRKKHPPECTLARWGVVGEVELVKSLVRKKQMFDLYQGV